MKSTENTDVQLEQIGIVSTIVEGQEPATAKAIDGTVRTLNVGEAIYLHDVVLTSDNTYIKITLDDDTLFELGPNSNASLDKYVYDPDASNGEFEAFVSSGSFHYISGKISGDNQGQHTLIKTPSAQIGIRGSEITAEISEDGSTTILHMAGLVSIFSNYTLGEVLVYERGISTYIPNHDAPSTVNQFTEEQIQYHTQEWQTNTYSTTDNITPDPETLENAEPTDYEDKNSNDFEDGEHINNINNQYSPAKVDIHNHGKSLDGTPTAVDVIGEGKFKGKMNPEKQAPLKKDIAHHNNEKPDNEKSGKPQDDPSDIRPKPPIRLEDESQGEFLIKPPVGPNQPPQDGSLPPKQNLPAGPNQPQDGSLPPKQNLPAGPNQPQDGSLPPKQNLPTEPEQPQDGSLPTNPSAEPEQPQVDSSTPVQPVNNAPVAMTDKISGIENQPITIFPNSLLNNDFDPDGDSITITGLDNYFNGTAQINDNTLIFTPIIAGSAGFEYTITDSHGTNATGLVQIFVIDSV
ncbi:Ig-like domain-containing protein, partial [Thiotrichales bacterium HSG1]|nr:Ig-like domain-containing protein [Thiotrichales bacterium HSG1]